MKGPLVNIILLLSFGAILLVYDLKDKRNADHVDYMERSLSELKQVLPANARLHYQGTLSDTVNFWEVQLMVRYLLIPAATAIDIDSDTTIYVARRSDTTAIPPTGQVIWHHEDSVYSYKLIEKEKR